MENLLTITLLLPLAAAFLAFLFPARKPGAIRALAILPRACRGGRLLLGRQSQLRVRRTNDSMAAVAQARKLKPELFK